SANASETHADGATDEGAVPHVAQRRRLFEPAVRDEENVGTRSAVEQGEWAAQMRRQHVSRPGVALEAIGLASLGQARQRALPLRGGEAGSLGIDHDTFARSETFGEAADGLDLARAVARGAAHEDVGQPIADEIETGIPEQLVLEHVEKAVTVVVRD